MKKRYWALVALAAIAGLDGFIQAPDSRSRELTRAIEARASDALRSYPYQFHVMRVEGDVAYLSTPRNFDVPAFKALGAMFPDIDTRDANNPAFIAAETRLGEVQSEARAIVLAQPNVRDVRWELDRKWLSAHNIDPPPR